MVINTLSEDETRKLIEFLGDIVLCLGWKIILPKDTDLQDVHGIMVGDTAFIDAWRRREQIKDKELQ